MVTILCCAPGGRSELIRLPIPYRACDWARGAHTSRPHVAPLERGRYPTRVAVKRFRRGADRDSLRSIDSVEEDMTASPIRPDRTPVVRRNLPKAEPDARVVHRRLAITNALEGVRRGTARGWWPQQTIAWVPVLAVASLALAVAVTAADARGGRSHGRRIKATVLSNPSSTPAATTSVPSQSAQPADPPAQSTVSLRNVGVIAVPPPPPPPTPAAQIAAPPAQLLPIAPLSIATTTADSTVPTALPTGGSSGVPLPGTPGGGREGLAACMEFWDSETHMTKAEWKASCERSAHRLDTISGTKKP
jgi:hypothetical protein